MSGTVDVRVLRPFWLRGERQEAGDVVSMTLLESHDVINSNKAVLMQADAMAAINEAQRRANDKAASRKDTWTGTPREDPRWRRVG